MAEKFAHSSAGSICLFFVAFRQIAALKRFIGKLKIVCTGSFLRRSWQSGFKNCIKKKIHHISRVTIGYLWVKYEQFWFFIMCHLFWIWLGLTSQNAGTQQPASWFSITCCAAGFNFHARSYWCRSEFEQFKLSSLSFSPYLVENLWSLLGKNDYFNQFSQGLAAGKIKFRMQAMYTLGMLSFPVPHISSATKFQTACSANRGELNS